MSTRIPGWLPAAAALALSSMVCTALLVVRVRQTDSIVYGFMPWNLFLAWIPMLLALIAYGADVRGTGGRLLFGAVAPFWLLFFPNAPYVITDLKHLHVSSSVPVWYDAVLMTCFVSTGLSLGLVSLYLMHNLVRRMVGAGVGWLFAISSIGLAAFGMYLGRVMRFNSWDAIQEPDSLARYTLDVLTQPTMHADVYRVCAVLSVFLISAYLTLFTVARLEWQLRR